MFLKLTNTKIRAFNLVRIHEFVIIEREISSRSTCNKIFDPLKYKNYFEQLPIILL